MKKITKTMAGLRLGVILSLILSMLTIGYSGSPYAYDELLISFKPGTTQGFIDSLRADYNAVEDSSISPSPVTGIHLWKIIRFPATGINGNNLNDINEVIGDGRPRTRINTIGLNYESLVFSYDYDFNELGVIDPTILCSNEFSISCGTADQEVRVSILDTGIGLEGESNNMPIFNSPGLFNPFYGNYIGYDFVNQDPYPQDDHGHGTHIAGIIAEVATLSSAYSVEMESFKTHDEDGIGELFDIILAIDQSILNDINVINMSFSYQAPPPFEKVEPLEFAINIAGDHGILVLAAAGNDGQDNDNEIEPNYPASFICENIISVASVDCYKEKSWFSNFGRTQVDISALGEYLVAPDQYGNLVAKSGTSQATALITGIAAVLATNLNSFHYGPIKCSIMDGAEYNNALNSLMVTEGIVHATDAYSELMANCGAGYRSAPSEGETEAYVRNEISIFPDPFRELCHFEFNTSKTETVFISIYHQTGQLIYNSQNTLDKGTHILNWSPKNSIPAGIYFVQILSNGKKVTRKIVKQY